MLKLKSLLPTLITEERHTKLDINDAKNILLTQCKIALHKFNDKVIFRRFDKDIHDSVYIVRPRDSQRISAGTENYYNTLMDSSPHWKGYPSRSWSIIFADYLVANDYARGRSCHYVFPIGNPEIAISAESDFWSSRIEDNELNMSVFAFNNMIRRLMYKFPIIHDVREKDPAIFKKTLTELGSKIDQFLTKETSMGDGESNISDINKFFQYIIQKKKPAVECFYDFFTPDNSDTRKVKFSDMNVIHTECWTEGDCVVLQNSALFDIFGDAYNSMNKHINI